jgi:hypothetical protein
MKRLAFILLLLVLAVTAGFFLLRPKPEPPIVPATPPDISVTEANATVQEPFLNKGDKLVIRMETPRSDWKAITLAAQSMTTQTIQLDMGLAYELITVDPPILPEVSLDAVVTPNRFGLGGSIPITEHVDLEAGISRRWDDAEMEKYIGVGFHLAF